MHTDLSWRTRLFRDGKERYIDEVIRPALADLAETRRRLPERMPGGHAGGEEAVALSQTEIERINAVEARLRVHMSDTVNRSSRRQAPPSAD